MNTKSIRFRIVLWYSLTLFLATAFVFASFYFVTRQILFVQVDKELASHTSKVSDILTRQGLNQSDAMLREQLSSEFTDIPGMVVVLLDKDGNVVQSSLTSNNPFETYKSLFKKAKDRTSPTFEDQIVAGSPMRFIGQPLKSDSNLLGVVLVAHPVDAIQKSLNLLLFTLGIVFAVLIVPTILGARMLAFKIMGPILKMSLKMEKISSEHLGERIENPRTSDEIEKLVTTFNGLLDRIQESFERERRFIGDVAHELKTPVATLRSGIEFALSKERTIEEYRESLGEALVDSVRLSTIIKNVLDLAWINEETARLGQTHFDLSKTFLDIKDIALELAAQKKINIKTDLKPGIEVIGSADKLQRAFVNVVDNAIKYTPGGGTVSLRLYKKAGGAIIEVKDTGVGISEKELPHIFERFYRGTKTDKTLGSGLGLAIAQGIIKAHQGGIKVTSRVGRGTLVSIFLPLAENQS